MYRIGLIGTGRIAHTHVEGIRRVLPEKAEITAVSDPRAELRQAFCEQYGIPNEFSSIDELARSGTADVVIDLTPPFARLDVVPTAIENGLHILVEKPFGATAKDAAHFVRLAEDAGVKLSVNQNFRWHPEIEATKEAVNSPTFGRLQYISHVNFQDRTVPPGDWRKHEKRLELSIFSIHVLDRIIWVANRNPISVSAHMRQDSVRSYAGEQLTTLTVVFEDGLIGTMTSSWLSVGLPEARLRVDSEHASVLALRPHALRGDATWHLQYRNQDAISKYFRDTGDDPLGIGVSLSKLLDALDTGAEPVNSGRDNLRTIGAVDAAYLSAERDGEYVTLEEVLGFKL